MQFILKKKKKRLDEKEVSDISSLSIKEVPTKQNVHFSSERDDWETPIEFFNALDCVFNFKLDPCCYDSSAKCVNYFTKETNGLAQDWSVYPSIFMNPPYGKDIFKWMKKAYHTSLSPSCPIVVCLVPARSSSKWCQFSLKFSRAVTFVRGRLKFGGSTTSAPFPSLVVVFSRLSLKDEQRRLLTSLGKTFFNSSI